MRDRLKSTFEIKIDYVKVFPVNEHTSPSELRGQELQRGRFPRAIRELSVMEEVLTVGVHIDRGA